MNIESNDLPNVIYLSLLIIMLASSVILNSRLKASQLLKQAFWWVIIILVGLVLYSFRHDFSGIKNRVAGELFPSKVVKMSENQIAISVADDGHFYIDILVNSKPVRFMIDTGASDISMNLSDAKRVGIDIDNISAFRRYQTANGVVINGIAKVDEIDINGIKFYDVNVSVSNRDMGISLLGMSFLKRFEKYEFYQDRLVLTTIPN